MVYILLGVKNGLLQGRHKKFQDTRNKLRNKFIKVFTFVVLVSRNAVTSGDTFVAKLLLPKEARLLLPCVARPLPPLVATQVRGRSSMVD